MARGEVSEEGDREDREKREKDREMDTPPSAKLEETAAGAELQKAATSSGKWEESKQRFFPFRFFSSRVFISSVI